MSQGANAFERLLIAVGGPSLDDARNRYALEHLASVLAPPVALRRFDDVPAFVGALSTIMREVVVHARWIEHVDRGLRTIVMTNVGQMIRSGRLTQIEARQLVAVMLPNATAPHVLAPLRLPQSTFLQPHLTLAAPLEPATVTVLSDHLWTLGGNVDVAHLGDHGYRFAGCIDGVLYAIALAPSFDPPRALAARADLLALAWQPWVPPSAAAVASVAANIAEDARQRRILITGVLVMIAVIFVPLLLYSVYMALRMVLVLDAPAG